MKSTVTLCYIFHSLVKYFYPSLNISQYTQRHSVEKVKGLLIRSASPTYENFQKCVLLTFGVKLEFSSKLCAYCPPVECSSFHVDFQICFCSSLRSIYIYQLTIQSQQRNAGNVINLPNTYIISCHSQFKVVKFSLQMQLMYV